MRLLVGFPPGGGADLATRVVSEGLSDKWKQQAIVENKPGAGARLAMDAATKAAPDGYTLLVAPGSPEVNRFLFSTLTFDPVADLAPISLIGTYPNIIAVANNSQFQKLDGFHRLRQGQSRQGELGVARRRYGAAFGRRAVQAHDRH